MRKSWIEQDERTQRVMKVHVFDVEHGNCMLVEFPFGERMMIDCGHNSISGWGPVEWLCKNGGWITNLTVHISMKIMFQAYQSFLRNAILTH